ncbi:unnamed protein product [Sympodiomycopsis kandeliae]
MSSSTTNTSSLSDTGRFAAGQLDPVWPADKPLEVYSSNYVPARLGHPPTGTVPDEIVPAQSKKPLLFESIKLPHSDITLKNRVVVSPMCQYSCKDGHLTPYHIAHLGQFALHGVGTIVVEASGVTAAGRITPQDAGIWSDEHIASHASVVSTLKAIAPGVTVVLQLAHAGRKASTWSPYHRGEKKNKNHVTDAEGGWEKEVLAPSPIAYNEGHIVPQEMSTAQVEEVRDQFIQASHRAFKAGYDGIEVHSAHGYYLHSALSPLSNKRTDKYGGSFENRVRLLEEIVDGIKTAHPDRSVSVRVSGTDFVEGTEHEKDSWTVESTKQLAQRLASKGQVDILDVSAGGLVPFQKISPSPGYQAHLAEGVNSLQIPKTQLLVGSVGQLEGPNYAGEIAEELLQDQKADLIYLARGLLANPSWVQDAGAHLMGVRPAGTPQYHRVHPAKVPPARAQNTN